MGLVSVQRASAATPVFMADTDEATYNTIFRVDQTNGHLTQLGSIPFSLGPVYALAAASDKLLYAVATGGDVLQITASPFTVTSLGSIGANGVVGLAFSSDGKLYATDELTEMLEIIQPSPLAVMPVGEVHLGTTSGPLFDVDGGDIAQDASGAWYLWSNATEALYLLDVTDAVATPVASQMQGLGPVRGLAFDYQGGGALLAFGGSSVALETLNPATGAATSALGFCLACPAVYAAQAGDLASPRCTDVDGDHYSPEGGPCGPADCNDADASIHPGVRERCNGVDDDCNGIVDDDPVASNSCATRCTASAKCVKGGCVTTPIVCGGDACREAGKCDPSTGGCVRPNKPDGTPCSDGKFCNGTESCQAGLCTRDRRPLNCGDRPPWSCIHTVWGSWWRWDLPWRWLAGRDWRGD